MNQNLRLFLLLLTSLSLGNTRKTTKKGKRVRRRQAKMYALLEGSSALIRAYDLKNTFFFCRHLISFQTESTRVPYPSHFFFLQVIRSFKFLSMRRKNLLFFLIFFSLQALSIFILKDLFLLFTLKYTFFLFFKKKKKEKSLSHKS